MTGRIVIDATKGTVKQDLAKLPEKMVEAAYEELLQQAELMKGLAQVYVRVDTGSLRDSIRVERVNNRVVRVRAGGYVTNPKTGRLVNYASIIEAKYPFMRPAWDQVKGNIVALIERRIVDACNP